MHRWRIIFTGILFGGLVLINGCSEEDKNIRVAEQNKRIVMNALDELYNKAFSFSEKRLSPAENKRDPTIAVRAFLQRSIQGQFGIVGSPVLG